MKRFLAHDPALYAYHKVHEPISITGSTMVPAQPNQCPIAGGSLRSRFLFRFQDEEMISSGWSLTKSSAWCFRDHHDDDDLYEEFLVR